MNDMNTVSLTGRLTRDADLKYLQNGTPSAQFSLAVNGSRKTGSGWEDTVSYFDCSLYGKSAENIGAFLVKGKQVAITGELRQNRWEQDGQSRSRVLVIIRTIMLLGNGSKEERQTRQPAPRQETSRDYQRKEEPRKQPRQRGFESQDFNNSRNRGFDPPQGKNPGFPGPEEFDDDIPF